MNLPKLWSDIAQNVGFLAVVVVITAVILLFAKFAENKLCMQNENPNSMKRESSTRKIAVIGMLSAAAFVLQIFDFPLPFAPAFYKLDFSEIPVLLCAFTMGPTAGVISELIKNLLKVLLRGTSTAFVGDFANFAIGCSLILPASIIYCRNKVRKTAIIGCILGTLIITIVGSTFNAVYLLPAFARLYGMELDAIIAMGAAIFPNVENFNMVHFIAFCVAPINLIKGVSVSIVVLLIYNPLERILRQQF